MLNYFETDHYIFVNGWIACKATGYGGQASFFKYMPNWRKAESIDWDFVRWYNGMDAAQMGVIEPNKTIVCRHWHSSYGHAKFEGKSEEWGSSADFSPYYGNGIIAIDACTAVSGEINCIIFED